MTHPRPAAETNDRESGRGVAFRRVAAPLGVLAACVVAFLWDTLFAGRAFVMRDAIYDFLPWRRFAAEAAREGSVPLWNPWSRFGQPFVANPQSAFFYPPHHLFDVLPVRWAFAATIALHLFVAAAGAFALLVRFRLSRAAALLGGVVFAFGTYFTANLEFMSVMDTLAWAPLTILLVCRVGDAAAQRDPGATAAPATSTARRLARPVVLLAAVVALQVFAGQPQVLIYTAVAAATYAAALASAERGVVGGVAGVVAARTGARAVVTPLAALAAAALLAAGLAAIQLLPTLDVLPDSVRAESVDPGLDIASMPAGHLVTLLFPLAYGRPGAAEWWSPSLFEFWLGCLHVGLLPLVCASLAALPRRDAPADAGARVVRRIAVASAALCVVGVLVAMGRNTPVYGLLQSIPGVSKVRWPAKGLQLTAIGLSALAAIGFDGVLARRAAAVAAGRSADRATLAVLGAWAALAVLLVVGAVGAGANVANWLAGPDRPRTEAVDGFLLGDVRRSAVFLTLAVAVLAAAAHRAVPRRVAGAAVLLVAFANLHLVSRDVQWVGDASALTPPAPALPAPPSGLPGHVHTAYYQAGFLAYGARDAAPYALAAAVLAGEVGMPDEVSSTYGGDVLQVARVVDIVNLLDSAPPAARARLADVLAVDREIRGAPFDEIVARGPASLPRATARPQALPRAFLAERWESSDDPVAALQRLVSGAISARRVAIEDTSSGAPRLPAPPAATESSPPGRIVAVRPGRDRVDVDLVADRASLLVLCETWLPGWTATVDGADTPVRRVNAIFRGVPVPAGARHVAFVYAPTSFRTGAYVSAAALAAAVALWFASRRGRPVTT